MLDRSSPSLVAAIRTCTSHGRGVAAILDVVGAARTQREIFDTLDPEGEKVYAQVWTGEEEIETPEWVKNTLFRSRDVGLLKGAEGAMRALEGLLGDGRYGLPLEIRNVGCGLEGLEKGLDVVRGGVSGWKVVVGLED